MMLRIATALAVVCVTTSTAFACDEMRIDDAAAPANLSNKPTAVASARTANAPGKAQLSTKTASKTVKKPVVLASQTNVAASNSASVSR